MLDRVQTRCLYRSRKNVMIAGVAGGIAEYFDIDPILARVLLLVALAPTGPFALIVYAILAMIIPPAPAGEDQGAVVKQQPVRADLNGWPDGELLPTTALHPAN